jgi:hypothetical protein
VVSRVIGIVIRNQQGSSTIGVSGGSGNNIRIRSSQRRRLKRRPADC